MTETERDRLLRILVSMYEGAWDKHWDEADELAEMATGDPFPRDTATPNLIRTWLNERLR